MPTYCRSTHARAPRLLLGWRIAEYWAMKELERWAIRILIGEDEEQEKKEYSNSNKLIGLYLVHE